MEEFLKSAFSALPSVASSPLAFLGYIIVTAAWVVIALKVKRNKNVLEHIKDFKADDRAQVLRDEMGIVPLKEGLTAEQYLRSRIHRYYFYGFALICFLILAIFVVSAYWAKNKNYLNVNKAELELATSEEINNYKEGNSQLILQFAVLGKCKKVELVKEGDNKYIGLAFFEYGSKRAIWVTVDEERFYWELAPSGQEGWVETLMKQFLEVTQ